MDIAIDNARLAMARSLDEGCSGVEACRKLSLIYDDVVGQLWRDAIGSEPESAKHELALVAIGGWGREEICPYSDIDFIIISRELSVDREWMTRLVDKILYPLWDAKIKVGHAVRTIFEAVELTHDDLPSATALLNARFVIGNEQTFAHLSQASRRAIAPGGNANQFIAKLQAEQARRHDRFGDSLYLLEPNLKQGIGGLRDYNTAQWAAGARWCIRSLTELLSLGILSKRQSATMERSLDFLLKLRCYVQLEAGRATDQLSFEIQETIAPRLFPKAKPADGVIVPSVGPHVEALMREFYLRGRDIARIADRILEDAQAPLRRKPRIQKVDANFLMWNGMLAVREASVFHSTPSEMLRYFRVAQARGVPLYGHTKELIEARVAESQPLETETATCRYFLDALVDLTDTGQSSALREMHSVGLIAALIPEFGPCTGRVQHDLYHVYTVDHHQLFAVDLLKKTGRGELDSNGTVAMEAYATLKEVESLFLATLLHDVAKPLGTGHAAKGGAIVARVAGSFGMSDTQIAIAEFLVRQHLTMSHISQRRDLSDPDVIGKFAQLVGNVDVLTKLYLLTRCDTAMTGPGTLSSWKDQLLSELYIQTRNQLLGGRDMESDQALHRRHSRQRAVEIASRYGGDLNMAVRAQSLVECLEDSVVNTLTARQLARLVLTVLTRQEEEMRFAIVAQCVPDRGQTELICVCDDAPAVLAQLTGVLAAHRVHIDSATISSFRMPGSTNITAVQVFQVRDELNQSIPSDDRRWARVKEDFLRVNNPGPSMKGPTTVAALLAKREQGYSVKPQISGREDTQVKVFDGESSEFSVVEVHTPDDVGILFCITQFLADRGLDIHRALISTEGDRIADVFYLKKIKDGSKLSKAEGKVVATELILALDATS